MLSASRSSFTCSAGFASFECRGTKHTVSACRKRLNLNIIDRGAGSAHTWGGSKLSTYMSKALNTGCSKIWACEAYLGLYVIEQLPQGL